MPAVVRVDPVVPPEPVTAVVGVATGVVSAEAEFGVGVVALEWRGSYLYGLEVVLTGTACTAGRHGGIAASLSEK